MEARRAARRRSPATIDGEAVVLERRTGSASVPPLNDNRPAAPAFRPSAPPPCDLFFQGAVPRPLEEKERSAAVLLGAAGVAALVGLAASGLADGRAAVPLPPPAAFALSETEATLLRRADGGTVLEEGRTGNSGAAAGPVPPVAVRQDGRTVRVLRPRDGDLEPRRSLLFHSTFAHPSATSAPIGIALGEAADDNGRGTGR